MQNFLYASFQTGSNPAGFSSRCDSQVFQPEAPGCLHAGSKNRIIDDRLEVDGEAFHWRYDDQQVSAITQDTPGRYQPRHP